jgi:hypothetical protein
MLEILFLDRENSSKDWKAKVEEAGKINAATISTLNPVNKYKTDL